MARHFLQTGPTPSPLDGGTTSLATTGSPVEISSASSPIAGQVLTAIDAASADWQTPSGGGVVDNPIVQTAGFTAAANTRYFLNTSSAYTVYMPASPVDGDIVALVSVDGTSSFTLNGNGADIFHPDATLGVGPSWSWEGDHRWTLAWRYTTAIGNRWFPIDYSPGALNSYPQWWRMFVTDAVGRPSKIQLTDGDSVPGRVEGSDIKQLRPWNQAHNLYGIAGQVSQSISGTNHNLTPGGVATDWYRTRLVALTPTADSTIVTGLTAVPSNEDFVHEKVLFNSSATYWLGLAPDDSFSLAANRLSTPFGAMPSGFADSSGGGGAVYYVPPKCAVYLSYNSVESRWFVSGGPVGLNARPYAQEKDWTGTTTNATPTAIPFPGIYSMSRNDTCVALDLMVQAIETATGDTALYHLDVIAYRDGSGTVSIKGSSLVVVQESQAAWDVTVTIAVSTYVSVQVTGETGKTIKWRVTGRLTER